MRQEWYETPTHVVIDVMARDVPADGVDVAFAERTLTASLPLGGGRTYGLDLDLRHAIVPAESSFAVLPTKVEFKLKKRDSVRWGALAAAAAAAADEGGGDGEAAQPAAATAPPSYPTSKAKKTDWEALARNAEKEEAEEIKNSPGDAALNALFQQIYADGSDDIRRAMNKSFVESGGTVLSTNWGEVGKGKVDAKPPEGMEEKKYNQ